MTVLCVAVSTSFPEWKVCLARPISLPGLQSMAVSNEISGVQEQNNECASVQFYLSVHFKCAKKLLNLYFVRNSNKKGNNCCENIPIQMLFCPVFWQKQFGPKIRLHTERNGHS